MYNRYIPQSDGSYRHSQMEDNIPKPKPAPPCPQKISASEHHAQTSPSVPQHQNQKQAPTCVNTKKQYRKSEANNNSISSFLKQLLPKNFDTSDLMIVLLLLIMSGDCAEDQNTALLTLVLYLFL